MRWTLRPRCVTPQNSQKLWPVTVSCRYRTPRSPSLPRHRRFRHERPDAAFGHGGCLRAQPFFARGRNRGAQQGLRASPFGDAGQDGLAPGRLRRVNARRHLQEAGFQTRGRFKSRRDGLARRGSWRGRTRGRFRLRGSSGSLRRHARALCSLCGTCRARKSGLEFGRGAVDGQLAKQAGQAVFAVQELLEGLAHA